MPIIVNTKSGTVREITGQATIRLPGGREQALLPGMTVRAGDLILTTQNSIVEIVEDPAAPKLPPVPDAEVTRAIASIEDGRGGPGTGVIASDGTGLQPGLRVERISESIGASAFSLATASPPGSTPIEDRATTPEDGLAIDVPTTLELVAPELTNDNTPTISGRTNAPPGSVVTIEITDAEGRRQTVTAPVGPDGRYSVDVPQPLADGPYTATGSVTVPGGDSATARDDGLVDTTPPAPTITLLPIAGNDVVDATEAGGNVLVAGRAGGDARPGDTVTLTIGGQTFTTTVAADGSFSVSVPGSVLAGGSLVEASLTSVDAAGNSATVTASRPYALDAAPVAVNDAASVGEDGPAVAGDLTPGTPAQDRDPEGAAIVVVAVGAGAGAPAAGGVGSAVPGTWGELRVQADGSYAYTPGSTANALRAGETVTETFTYRIADPEGNTSTATLTITLAGAQDPAQLAGTLTGAVTEDGTLVTGGTATVADPDRGEAVFVPQTATAGTYGSFTIDAEGRWTYTLDNASPLVQALRGGQQVVELFTITSADGTTAQVRVVVNGTDDGVVVTPGRGEVIEDRAPTTGGTLTANDPDNPGLAFVPTVQTGAWGELRLGADGGWSYTLGDAAQVLRQDEVKTELFTVTLTDGSTTTITITVTGTADGPVLSTGRGAVTEDVSPTAGGTLTATDADNPALAFVPATSNGAYGSLAVAADGTWSYTLGAAAQALGGGEQRTEIFQVTLNDGSVTTVTIVVTGTDDTPVISSGTGAVTEDTAPSTSGTLTATDVDNPALAFLAATRAGAYGELVLAANGQWTYTLGPAAQALAGGQTATETFTVRLSDGSTTTVTITVTGTDDAPVISAGTGAVTEDTAPSTGGTLTATDADNPALAFVPATQGGAFGSLVLAANGQWTYTLGPAAQALAGGQTAVETFTVTLTDGSTTTVTITVNGTDDAPVISAGTGAVTEDTAPSTSGTLTATDVDNPALAFLPSTQAGAYGNLVLAANGQWTYALGPAAQALAGGQTAVETFTVTLTDGSTTTVTITVTGTDDAPVISAGTGAVTEDTVPSTSGTLTATDVDNPALAFLAATQAGAYGELVLASNGQWTYTLGPAAQALAGGQTATETFTVTLSDGSTTTVTITVTGTDDAPVISAGTGAVTEDTAPSTSGTLTATDVDNPALAFLPSTQAGAYGNLVLGANGQWTYTLGPAAQALAGGQTAVETFTVALTDGSTTQVTVNITGTNDAPALDLDANDSSGATGADYRGAFAAGNGPVSVVDADVALTDIDGSRYTGATVTLTNARAGDVLAVGTLPPGLSAVVNGNTVTLSGSGSAADYALALRAISFDNTLAAPDATPRVFSITVSDGISDSNTASSTITIGDANDAPLNALPASVDTFEDRLTPITGVSVSDADESGGDASFKLSTVQVTVAHGALQVTLAAGASIVAGAAGSGTLTLSGSQAAINATLATLAYLGDANFSGADTLVVTSRDGQGLVDTDSVAINVAPVNDAPSGADRTITIAEDGSHVLVRADFGFADAPGENNAFASVTVAPPTQGTLLLNGVAITGATVVTVAQLDAGVLRFVPAADANGIAYAGFDFRVTDDGGIANGGVDTDPTANRITFDVTPVNDAPTVGNANASVSEEGLFGGVADGSGTPDTTDGTTASGRVAIGDVDSATLTVTLQAPTATLTSGGVAITWSGAGTDTLVGTAGGRTVATLTIDASGQYDFRLLGPLDHPGANAEDVLALQFGVVASDSSVSTRGTLTVNVEDDAPVSAPPASVATLSMIDTNLMIVLDTSLSMNQTDGVNGTSRLASAVAAVNRLLDQYDSFGGVAVRLVTFNDVGEAVGTRWTSVADARAELQNLLTGGGTNYDSALAVARSAWTSTGKIDGAQNTLYFLSDGQPVPFARGIDATEEASWVGFLNDNQIRAFSIGLGVDAAQGPLNPVAYDGQIGENTNGILVRDFAQLDDALAATVPTLVGNPLLPGGTFDLPTSGIGADGGRVLSLTFGSTTYTFDPANGGSITVTGGPNQGVFDTTTDTLTVTTTAGGAFAVDLVNGKYSYSGPPSIGAPITETFGYVLVDGDGDTTTSSVSVSVERVTVQVGTTAADTLNGSTGQDFIIARSGNDTVSGSDNADRLAGNDGDDRLDGGAGNDALFGGSGSDTLDGGNGNDTLDGGVGGDRLTGGAGADVFAWTLADRGAPGAPPTDTTVDFAAAAPAQGGDALDLRDLLVGETSATLDRFLDFDVTAGGTTIRISSTGGFSGGGYSAAAEDQRIVLEGVDIRAVLGLASGATDATIIQTLIDRSKLLVDSNA